MVLKLGFGKTTSLGRALWQSNIGKYFQLLMSRGVSLEAWDGTNLKFTFRRTVNRRDLNLWYELQDIARSICYSEEPDAIIWNLNSSGKYSLQSLYAVINDRGVKQVFSPVMWKILVPPRIHVLRMIRSSPGIT
jgi:hypothetical protein